MFTKSVSYIQPDALHLYPYFPTFFISNFVTAPILTVMDGFGRELLDQFYKVGSSLEVMCQVDRLPARPLPDIIEWRHGNAKLPKSNSTSGQRYVNCETTAFGLYILDWLLYELFYEVL